MLNKKIALIGGGNMGRSLLRGILKAGLTPPENLTVVDVHPQKLETLRTDFGVATTKDAKGAVHDAEIVILAVKPKTLREVLDSIHEVVRAEQLFISIIAGVETVYIEERLSKGNPVIRVMPNIAATVDAAASAIAAGSEADESHLSMAKMIFEAVGEVVCVEEEHLDAVTGLSGSGPAYIYMVVEAL